jgi:hypothetical protein
MHRIRRLWPVLALLAGLALVGFETRRAGGVTAENVFWVVVGALVVVLSVIDLFQKRPPEGKDEAGTSIEPGER